MRAITRTTRARRRRPAATTDPLTIPGLHEQAGDSIGNEDAIRLIVHEHPADFPKGLAEFGLAPRYAWESGEINADAVVWYAVGLAAGAWAVNGQPWQALTLGLIGAAGLTLGYAMLDAGCKASARRRRRRAGRGYLR